MNNQKMMEAAFQIREGETGVIRQGLQGLRKALRDGANPNHIENGVTALTSMMTRMSAKRRRELQTRLSRRAMDGVWTTQHNARLKGIEYLISAGADPWIGDPNTFKDPDFSMSVNFLQHMATLEKDGHGLRGSNGETPWHAAVGGLAWNIDLYLPDAKNNLVIWPEWLYARDQQGQTPLHHAWRALASLRDDDPMLALKARLALTITLAYSRHEPDQESQQSFPVVARKAVMEQDDCGVRVADLILQETRIQNVLNDMLGTENAGRWMGCIQNMTMERDTLGVETIARKRAPRL